MNAAWSGYDAVVRLLLDRGAAINTRTFESARMAAGHFAADGGNLNTLRLLLSRGLGWVRSGQ